MKRVGISVLVMGALLVAGGPAAAIDFGFQLSSNTELDSREEDEIFNSETLAAWLSHDFSDALAFSTQGSYTFTTERPYLFDLDALYLDGSTPAGDLRRVGGRIGRFSVADATGYVLDHRIDGARFSISAPDYVLSFSGGYTGLLLKPTNDVIMSRLDLIDDDDDDVFLAPPRLIGLAELSLPEVLPAQDLTISLALQEDLRPEDDLIDEGQSEPQAAGGGRVDTQYASVELDGALSNALFYTVFGTFQTGRMLSYVEDEDTVTGFSYRYRPVFAGAGGAGMRYYVPDIRAQRAGFNVLVGTGDSDATSVIEGNEEGASTLFVPIAGPTTGKVLGAGPGNNVSVHAFYSIKPFIDSPTREIRDLQFGLDAFTFIRLVEGPVPADGVRPGGSGNYLGSEIDAGVNYRPFSDLGISLTGGVFLPNGADDGPIAESERDPSFAVSLEASLSF